MALYDEIKNTFDENKILEILKLYCNNNNNLYNILVHDHKFQDYTTNTYKVNFLHYIQNPYISELYNSLKNLDLEATDKNISEYIEKIKNRNDLNPIQIYDTIDSVERYWLYPLSKYKEIFNKFNSYEELLQYLEKMNFNSIDKDIENIALFPNNPTVLNQAKENIKNKINISNKDLEELLLVNKLKNKLRIKFWGGVGIMGFHVNKTRVNPSDETNQKAEIKFYINVGTDSYQFANIFRKKCQEKNIDYSFKVVDPYRHKEYERVDKICIWSSFEDAERIVNVLKEIKKEHPEFDYQKPPLLCGMIDNFIGVGQDFNSSFNHGMSMIIEDTINNILGTNNKQEILKIVSSNPNKLTEIKNEIIKQAEAQGLDPTKMCVNKNTKAMLSVFDNKIHCIRLDDKYYINRSLYEYARKNNINIEGTPRILGGKNFYEVTEKQLQEIVNTYKNKNNNIKTNNKQEVNNNNSIKTNNKQEVNNNNSIKTDNKQETNNDKYIPGTNILKPRNRGVYETDKEYEKYLENYYNSVFKNNKSVTTNPKTVNLNIIIENDIIYTSNIVNPPKDRKKIILDGKTYIEITKEEISKEKERLSSKGITLNIINKKQELNDMFNQEDIDKNTQKKNK